MKQSIFAITLVFMSLSTLAYEAVPNEYLVKMNIQNARDGVQKLKNFRGVEKVSQVSEQWFKVRKSSSGTEDLAKLNFLEKVEPNFIYRTQTLSNDPKLRNLWAFRDFGFISEVGIDQAWNITTGNPEVVIAVIDTGVNYNHPDLKENIWINKEEANGAPAVDDDGNGYVDDIYGMDFSGEAPKPNGLDDHGHGSHCAGTLGARGNNGVGISGVNWSTQIMAVKFISGKGQGTLEGAILAIDYAVKNGARVLNNSWGGGGPSEALKEAILRAHNKGVLFVAAAGNDSKDNDVKDSFPANFDVPNVISVASLTSWGNVSNFSNFGKGKVHLAAPGSSIYSTHLNSDYMYLSGTSMAAPHVSGAAALVWGLDTKRSHMEVKEILLSTVKKSGSLSKKVQTGALNIGQAVEAAR